jgi:hypothetical protein
MLARIALTLSALLLAACSGSAAGPAGSPAAGTAPGGGGPLEVTTIVQQSNPGQSGDTVREVIRDQAAWTALWTKLREGSALPEAAPEVDFAKDMVIAAAMPTQGCVSKVTIRAVSREGDGLVVDVLEAPPAPNCVCFVSERPIHVVRVPKAGGEARFAVEQGRTSC